MTQTQQQVAEHVVAIIQESATKSQLGSHLSVMLKHRCPGFKPRDYGSSNLREFVKSFVPQVYESRRQGLDCVYSLAPVVAPAQATEPSAYVETAPAAKATERPARVDDAIWKSFVSPNSPYRLFINPGSSEFQVLGAHEPPMPTPWIQLPPCPAAKHKLIAEAFANSLGDGKEQETLTRLFSERVWWVPFFAATRDLGIEKRWLDFRQSALFSELQATAVSLGLNPDQLSTLRKQGAPIVRRPNRERQAKTASAAPDNLRSTVLAIVTKLPESELRELRFRLGDIFDALSNQ